MSPKETLGTLTPDIQLSGVEKVHLFSGNMGSCDVGDLTSLDEAELSHIQDASLI